MKLTQLLEGWRSNRNQRPPVIYFQYEEAVIDPNDPDGDDPKWRTLNITATISSDYDESGDFEEFELVSMTDFHTGEKVTEVSAEAYEEIQAIAFEQIDEP